MLDQLRRHAKSFVTKFILGAMAFGLIFYFGYAGLRKHPAVEGGRISPIAVVNGEAIPRGKFEQAYENQLKFYQQITQGAIPETLLETLKQSVLEKLIQTKIFAQQSRGFGLEVSDKELAQEIAQNQSFYHNGVFNKKYYLETFKPMYDRQFGEDYEDSLREDLLAEKFENLIRDSIQPTDEEVRQEFILSKTELNLQKITLDLGQWKEDQSVRSQEAELEILTVLKAPVLPKGPNPLEALKKKYDLKVEETGFHSLRDKAAFLGDPEAHEAYACLVNLSSQNPLCPKGYILDGAESRKMVFFKLMERKEPNFAQFEQEKEALRKNLQSRLQVVILKQISDALIRQSSIQVHLKT